MIKILKSNIFKNPNFIYKTNVFDLKQYDRVYENWNRPTHESWKIFQQENKIKVIEKFDNKEKYQYIGNLNKVGYIFFKDRTDKRNIEVTFANGKKPFLPNTLLILSNEYSINFSKPESTMPDKPFLVVAFDSLQ